MPTPGPFPRVRKAWTVFRRYCGRGLLCILTSCHNPAMPYTGELGPCLQNRNLVAVCQVGEDTVAATANRPLETLWSVVTGTVDHVRAVTQGGLGKRLLVPLHGRPGPLPPAPQPLDPSALEDDLRHLTGRELNPANVQLFIEGREAFTTLEELLARATKQIDIIMFQWENDPLGQALVARLVARAGPGLRIRILIDGGGNLCFNEPDELPASEVNRVLLPLMCNPYIELVRIRNPFARYDHRKLVLIDGRIAWSGGRNFSREAFFDDHDLSYTLEGPLVPRLQQHFDQYWREQNGLPYEAHHAREPLPPCPELPHPNTRARFLYSEPNKRQIARAIYRAVDLAQRRIYVENVYLTDSLLICKLAEARRRGVDVRVVLTIKSTTEIINRANRVIANRLLAAGVRVYLYPGMTHVKALTVDGVWAYVGTGNLDALSFRHNRELGLSVSGCPLIGQLEQCLFLPDMRPDWEMTHPLPVGPRDYYAEMVASLCL